MLGQICDTIGKETFSLGKDSPELLEQHNRQRSSPVVNRTVFRSQNGIELMPISSSLFILLLLEIGFGVLQTFEKKTNGRRGPKCCHRLS
jgi:hypothetical protein